MADAVTIDSLKDKFQASTKEVEIKSWGGTVTIKKLTIEEANRVQALIVGDATVEDAQDGKVEVSISDVNEAMLLKASLSLVQPKMKAKELGSLSPEAMEGVNDIVAALDAWDKPKKSKAKT
jgi:predicted nucleotidyltransferase